MTLARSASSEGERSRAIGAGLCGLSAAGFATLSVFGKIAFASGLTLAGMLSLRFAGAALVLGLGLWLTRRSPAGGSLRLKGGILAPGMVGDGGQPNPHFRR